MGTATDSMTHDADKRNAIRTTLDRLFRPGDVIELRIPNVPRCKTVSGFFNDWGKFADTARQWDGKGDGVFVVLNPIKPALLARRANRVETYADKLTQDDHITHRRWLFIDLDAAPVAGISTSDAEHEAALATGRAVREWLTTQGWPPPIMADSGNGCHLLYPIDLPNDKASAALVERCLNALAFRFNDSTVSVDETTFNASRLVKLYGTRACKGDSLPERPHRQSRLLAAPERTFEVSRQLLEGLAARAPAPPAPARTERHGTFDLDSWLAASGLDYSGPVSWKDGRKWVLPVCPWNPDHTNKAAYIVQFGNGAIAAGCHHNSCAGRNWQDLRDLLEPNRRVPGRTAHQSEHSEYSAPPVRINDRGYSEDCEDSAQGLGGWEPPVALSDHVLPPFPTAALPSWVRAMVEAVAVATQTPADLAGMLALAALAAATAKKAAVQVKGGWTEPLNLWTLTFLPPANRKSAVFCEMTAPLLAWERSEARRFGPAVAEADSRRKILEAQLHRAEQDAAKAPTGDAAARERDALHLARQLAALPTVVAPRLVTDDCSPEKLAGLLHDHQGAMAILSPEGGVFDLISGRYSNNTPNLDVYLKGHAGDDVRVDRVGRPTEYISRPALTMGLTCQPEVLHGLAARPGFRGRGLLGRFLYALPASLVGRRDTTAPPVPTATRDGYARRFAALLALTPDRDGEGQPTPHVVRLDGAAQSRLRAFEERVERDLGEFGPLGSIADWGGKLVGAVVRVAGLLHVAEHPASPWDRAVAEETVGHAIGIGDYLIGHARAAFDAMGADATLDDAKYLLRWVDRQRAAGTAQFSRREAQQGTRGRFKRALDIDAPLRLLAEHGYIRERPTPKRDGPGQPPSPTYEVNPLWGAQNTQNPQKAGAGDHARHSEDSEYCEQTHPGTPEGMNAYQVPMRGGEADATLLPPTPLVYLTPRGEKRERYTL